MSRIAVLLFAALIAVHGLLTFALAITVFPGSYFERLAFGQHGFTFVFIALLNVVTWRRPSRPRVLALLVHAGNCAFTVFCFVFAVAKPEPPLYIASVLMLGLAVSAISADIALQREPRATS